MRRALSQAARNIARVAFRQIPRHFDFDVAPGVSIEQRVEPLARVGCYVPGGRFPLPSSLLMTAVPARVAGVREIFVVLPAAGAGGDGGGARGRRDAAVSRRRRARDGGAGLRHRVDTARGQDRRPGQPLRRRGEGARRRDCAIDFYAGPTEIVIVAGGGRPAWIAADLIAQAEHDPDARAILITWSRRLADRVAAAVAARSTGRAIVRTVADRRMAR